MTRQTALQQFTSSVPLQLGSHISVENNLINFIILCAHAAGRRRYGALTSMAQSPASKLWMKTVGRML